MKKIVVLLMFVKVLFASSLIVKDGNVTVRIGESERELPMATTIDLDKNVTVCYLSGNGRVTIDGLSRSADSKDKCYTTQQEKEFDLKATIAIYVKNTFVKLFQKSSDPSSLTLFRGGKNEKVLGVVTLQAGEEHLVIENDQWSPYPMTLRVKDANGFEIQQITKYIDDYDDMMVFDLNRSDLESGYRITVENKYGDRKLDVFVEFR